MSNHAYIKRFHKYEFGLKSLTSVKSTNEKLLSNFLKKIKYIYFSFKVFMWLYLRDIWSYFLPAYYSGFLFNISWQRSLSFRNQSIIFQSKYVEWFLDEKDLRHGRFKCSVLNTLTNEWGYSKQIGKKKSHFPRKNGAFPKTKSTNWIQNNKY